jgi:hypothetical protein
VTTLRIDTLNEHHATESQRDILRISWSVARGAIAGVPTLTTSAREHTLVLEATMRADHTVDSVRITVDSVAAPNTDTSSAAGGWMRDEHGLLHIRVFEPQSDTPLADLTVDTDGVAPKILYARTTILHALGIPGGRYELDGIELQTERTR